MRERMAWMAAGAASLAASVAAATAAEPSLGRIVELKTIFIEASSAREPAPGSPGMFYPPGARQFGVEGSAMVRCAIAPPDRFADCEVVEELPAGKSFGAYALEAAKRVRQPVEGVRKDEHVVALLPFSFTLEENRSSLLPDAQVQWEKKPGGEELSRVYPERARLAGREGWAVIGCHVETDGRLTDCRAYDEWPHGYRFTEAALRVADRFKMSSRLKNGQPLPPDAHVRIPISFKLPQ